MAPYIDPKVLDAQQWVNLTYGQVAGYEACEENGRVSWSTVYSLVMGLQHELGISPLAAAFGPTTMRTLQTLGDIGVGWTTNSNIVRILQHGLFCKGYWGANNYGEFSLTTSTAVGSLSVNMGLPSRGTVNAMMFRCILNMDAYVVVAGGTEKVREIQRWLNGRYWQRSAFDIGPCDGIYSRDVQKSLMVALQYELGIAEPTGNFGPGTQAGLRSQALAEGSSGIFVELFSIACVFNEPIPFKDDVVRTTQRSVFDPKLRQFVELFQEFSQLPVNGRADFQTWSQLLVSMGDPDRAATGCDTRFEITPSRAQWLTKPENAYRAVARYLYDPPGSLLDKNIKPGELQTIFDAGLKVLPIYQDNARRLSDFTYSQGFQHALNAHQLATGFGFNRGTVIYFAVDYDATQDDIDAVIIPYFQGIQTGLASKGKKYVHGVYGSRNVCTNVTNKTFARHSFVSGMSWGFSGNLGFPLPWNWSFNQIKEFEVINGQDKFDLDRDVWRTTNGDPGQGSINTSAGPADAFIDYVQRLYNCALEYGGPIDPSQLVMEFIRSREYNDVRWTGLIGPIDDNFVAFAKGKGFTIMKEFQDPFTGYTIGAEHMMATANGHFLVPQSDNPKIPNTGDIIGWGGDLLTFYADWRNSVESYSSGYTYCMERLAKPDIVSSFAFDDLMEDADGYLIARRLNSGTDIVTAVREHYNGSGGLTRFSSYYQQRFTNAETCNILAHKMLADSDYATIILAQFVLTMGHPLPSSLPYSKLQEFEQGFADTLLARTGLEASMAATYAASQQNYLRKAESRSAARK